MKALYRIYLVFAYLLSVGGFLVASFCVNLVCLIVGWIPGSNVLRNPLRGLLQFMFRRWAWVMRFIRVLDLTTPDKTSKKNSGGEIWVMNHPTILDASYMIKFITNGTCIYKQAIGANPFYGATAKFANYIPNVGGPDMIRMACDALAKGENLIILPEGTRSTRVNLDNFKPGFALIAKRSKAVINVLWMEAPDDFMTKDAPYWKVPALTANVTMEQINRVDPTEYKSVGAIMDAVKESYRGR